MGYLVQSRQGVRSTKHKLNNSQTTITPTVGPPSKHYREIHIHKEYISKIYKDDTGIFPISYLSGNQYLMIAYHYDYNAILVVPFKSHNDSHQLLAYNEIMNRLEQHNQLVEL